MSSTRRNLRLRREYLYRKSLEGKERALYDRKKRIQKALAEGKAIPTELRDDAQKLKASLDADDDVTENLKTHIDDEYAKAGIIDPKICVTTSRSPSSRLKAFAKEVRLIFPNSQRINRGNTQVGELVEVLDEFEPDNKEKAKIGEVHKYTYGTKENNHRESWCVKVPKEI